MRRAPRGPLCIALLVTATLYAHPAHAKKRPATELRIDLATDAAGTAEVPISTGKYRVVIENLAPVFFLDDTPRDARYKITILKETHDLAPLPLPTPSARPSDTAPNQKSFGLGPDQPTACTSLNAKLQKAANAVDARRLLDEAEKNKTVDAACITTLRPVLCTKLGDDLKTASNTADARRLLDEAEKNKTVDAACVTTLRFLLCPKLVEDLKKATDESAAAELLAKNHDLVTNECGDDLAALLSRMTQFEGTYDLRENQTLTVTIERGTDKNLRVWKRVYNAPASKGFRVSYGFNFIPNGDHEFFAKTNPAPSPTPSTPTPPYTLTEKTQTKSLDFAPSIFFSYPLSDAPLAFAIAAGLGFDFSTPVVFFGPSMIINQNIQLVAGVVMHQQERLRGEYTNGQSLNENLTNDQLTQKTYRPNAFVGLAFRFDSNPFASNSSPAKVATPAPTPAPTPKKEPGKPAPAPTPGAPAAPTPAPTPAATSR